MTDTPAPQTALAEALRAVEEAAERTGVRVGVDTSIADYDEAVTIALSERGYTIVASDRLDFNAIADDVRYGSAATTDYWRGYNNGINALVSRLARSEAAEKGARG